MKKIAILILTGILYKTTFAQVGIPYPNITQFDAFKNKELASSLKYAEELKGIKINFNEYKFTGKSEIIGFRREETKNITTLWPNDGCYVRYYYESSKILNGINSKIEIVAEFKRSYCKGENCYLENEWKPFVVNVIPFYEDAGLNKKEAMDLALTCIKSKLAKDTLLADYIKFDSIVVPDVWETTKGNVYKYSKIHSPNHVEFRVMVYGSKAHFPADRSYNGKVLENIYDNYTYVLKNLNGKWEVTGSLDRLNIDRTGSNYGFFRELPTKRFTPYALTSYESIKGTTKEESLSTDNTLNKLKTSSENFLNFIVTNTESLSKEKLSTFFEWQDKGNVENINNVIENLIEKTKGNNNGKIKFIKMEALNFNEFEPKRNDSGSIYETGSYTGEMLVKNYNLEGKKFKETGEEKINISLSLIKLDKEWKIISVSY